MTWEFWLVDLPRWIVWPCALLNIGVAIYQYRRERALTAFRTAAHAYCDVLFHLCVGANALRKYEIALKSHYTRHMLGITDDEVRDHYLDAKAGRPPHE